MKNIFIYALLLIWTYSPADNSPSYVDQAMQSVVGITVQQLSPISLQLNKHQASVSGQSGSGVILNKTGLILTNFHIIKGAQQIIITFNDGQKEFARIIGYDPHTDLAALQINNRKISTTPIKISQKSPQIGDRVLAIGNPLGLHQSVTSGVISSLHRHQISLGALYVQDFIQMDASINPGNSGGALITPKGELLGINTATISSNNSKSTISGIGFAIPLDIALPIMKQLIQYHDVLPSKLGIENQSINGSLAKALNLKSLKGSLVNQVSPNSNASHAGIEAGDVILKINETSIHDPNHLASQIYIHRVDTSIKITLLRNGKELIKTIQLENIKKQPEKPSSSPLNGVITQNFDEIDIHGQRLNGVRVLYVDPLCQAYLSGLAPGDVLLDINAKPLHSLSDIKTYLKKPENNNVFKIKRGDHTLFIAINQNI
ncbi:MAG TPA: trypsin-like peptidase domain-containing protein [Gammaproteobacteria bacterium]|nr:trypsin-like peptidase domain-containing protein [Gammaproteobacteria bacterium]